MKAEKRTGNLAEYLLSDPILLGDDPFRRKKEDRKRAPLSRIRFDWRDK